MRSHFGKKIFAAALLAATLAGCGARVALPPTTQPAPATTQPAPGTAQPAPGTAQPARPTFSMEPKDGAPGTTVTMRGWGYAPGAWIGVYLGTPNPVGTAMTSVQANGQGVWEARVVIPASLPDGRAVPAGNVTLVTMNDRFQALASAPFGFVAPQQPAPPLEQPLPNPRQGRDTIQTMIVAFGTAPAQRYVTAPLRAAMDGGQSFEQVMGFNPHLLTAPAEIGEPQLSGRTARIPVTLTFADQRQFFVFEMAIEQGMWKIAASVFQRSEPIVQTPPVNTAPAMQLNQEDSAALGQLMLDKLRPARPGRPILAHAVALADDYALGVARPVGEMDIYFYFKRDNGVWYDIFSGGPTTTDVLISYGIPVSLELPQPMFGVAMGVLGYYNGGSGGAADGYVVTDRIGDGYARATVYDAAQGPITAYVRLDGPTVVLAGQVFAPEVFDQLGIPMIVRA